LPRGDKLLADAQARLAEHASIAANVRQQIAILDQRLVGTGLYRQKGRGEDLLLRLELKIQAAGEVTSLLQVVDGRSLWTERQLTERRSVSRVDLRTVRAEKAVSEPGHTFSPDWVIGGLGQLLAGLQRNFELSSVEVSELAGLPVYKVRGHWRPERLQYVLSYLEGYEDITVEQVRTLQELPRQIPREVELQLGVDDLFPYVVEYRRSKTGPSGTASELMLRMELFEVAIGTEIEDRVFTYKTDDQSEDDTRYYIKQFVE